MTNVKTAPYGSWKSPITSDLIVRETIGLSQPRLDGDDTYWIEMRPSEKGRQVIVRRTSDGTTTDINPSGFNARTRVHEYGGGDYVVHGGTVYFSNFADQQIYRARADSPPQRISSECSDDRIRYADAVVDAKRDRLICVCEDHRQPGEAQNYLVSVPLAGGTNTVIVSGNDFYSSPRVSPDGARLAWLTWHHPNMPWDGCELWPGDLADDRSVINHQRVAGGQRESIFQPEWSPDGVLYFVAETSGWWNIYRFENNAIECVVEKEAEFGVAQWVFGLSTYAFESAARIICAFVEKGIWSLGTIDTRTRQIERIETQFTEIAFVRAAPGRALFRIGSPLEPLL